MLNDRPVTVDGGGLRGGTEGSAGTNGASAGTSRGAFWRRFRAPILLMWGFAAAFAIVNSLTHIDELARDGTMLAAWKPWSWEASSAIAWAALGFVVARLTVALRPPAVARPAAIALHAAMSVLVSFAHVGLMVALRHLAYWAAGERYDFVFDAPTLIYEYRKDLISYVGIALVIAAFDRWSRSPPEAPPAAVAPRIVVRDGARTHWLAPADIERVEAAGNYVELHTAAGPILHRASLAAIEATLASFGFVRVHRSRLVRQAAIATIETGPSGDFTIVLASGDRIGGSRRFRDRLAIPAASR